MSRVARELNNPYAILVSTLLSLRTRDKVTYEATYRLLDIAPDAKTLAETDCGTIAEAIYPVSFYRNKAESLVKIGGILCRQYNGKVPTAQDNLLELPGVGRKTANLVLNLAFGVSAICVDTHVHRISNRICWVDTRTPEETEYALMEFLPREYWIQVNEVFVAYGQHVCKPVSPLCSNCPIDMACCKKGVYV